jgi:hypothetical protein
MRSLGFVPLISVVPLNPANRCIRTHMYDGMGESPNPISSGICEAIERARATDRYLPKYSPIFNPTEMPHSKFKEFLGKVPEQTIPAPNRASRSFITTEG